MKDTIRKAAGGCELDENETFMLFEQFLGSESEVSDADIEQYLLGTSARLPTAAELIGAARSLRRHMHRLDLSSLPTGATVIDTCGTGGSGLNTFNTSTVSAIAAAAAGLYVAKHGNRAVSSSCGSADVLEALGLKLDLPAERLSRCLARTHFAFLFAPAFHPATKRVQTIRRRLGKRTIFNFLGPLVNPAGAQCQLLGVSNPAMVEPMAAALLGLGTRRALVVCGEEGLDEISLLGPSRALRVDEQGLSPFRLLPEEFGLKRAELSQISGATPETAAAQVRDVLNGEAGARRELVVFNAGASLWIAGAVDSLQAGMSRVSEVLDSGAARQTLANIVVETNAQ
jgi:anthranilate phosphoribosyltransferase